MVKIYTVKNKILPSNVELTNGQLNKKNLNATYSLCYLLTLAA